MSGIIEENGKTCDLCVYKKSCWEDMKNKTNTSIVHTKNKDDGLLQCELGVYRYLQLEQ
ncbi:MAG: hypothetical protein RR559_11765 [Bacteroides sp.]